MTRTQAISVLLVACLAPSVTRTAVAQPRARRAAFVSPAVAPDPETSAVVTAAIIGALDRLSVPVVRGDTSIRPRALRALWASMSDAETSLAFAASVQDVGGGDVRLRLVLGRSDGSGPFRARVIVARSALPGAVRAMVPALIGARERSFTRHRRVTGVGLQEPSPAPRPSGRWGWGAIAAVTLGGVAWLALIVVVAATGSRGSERRSGGWGWGGESAPGGFL